MAIKNRAEATALLAKIKALMVKEMPGLKVRQTKWQDLINEAVELDDFDAENLATDSRREADTFAALLNKIFLVLKRLSGLMAQDRRSGAARRQRERRRRKVAVAADRRKLKDRRQSERRQETDGTGAFIKKLKALVKLADKAYIGYDTDRDRFTDRVNPKDWDGSLLAWVEADNLDWEKVSKLFKNLFKMDAG